jgi:HK97 family phage portal protein
MAWWSNLFGRRSGLQGVEKFDDHVGPSFDLADAALAAYIRVGAQGVGEIDSWAALQQPAYWRAVNLLAGIVATLPLKAYRTDPKTDERTLVPSYLDNPAGPYPLTSFDWKHMVMIHLLIHGEADLLYIRNNAGQLIGLWPLHPTGVQVLWSEKGNAGKRFLVNTAGGKTLDSDEGECEVLQILGTTLDGLRGVNPLVLHRKVIQTAQAQEQSANRIATNGNLLSGLVAADQEDIDEEDAKIIKAGLDEKMVGPSNAGGIAFVNKRLKFTPWTMNSVEAQLLQSREYSVDEVGRMFGIPAHLLGSQAKATSWGTGILEMNLALQKFTLMPWTSRIEEALSTTLPAPRHAEFLYKGLFQGTPMQEVQSLMLQTGGRPLITVNEARAILNLDKLNDPEADKLPPMTPPQQDVVPSANPDQGAGK